MHNVSIAFERGQTVADISDIDVSRSLNASISYDIARTLSEAVFRAMCARRYADIAFLGNPRISNIWPVRIDSVRNSWLAYIFGEYVADDGIEWPDFYINIFFDQSSVGDYETIYEDKLIDIRIGS